MPLIVISGYPCAGKTYRARQIEAYFAQRAGSINDPSNGSAPDGATTTERKSTAIRTVYISDHRLGIGRAAYATAAAEKTARAQLAAEVIRNLAPSTLVLVDAPNYIKGFRYQLFCEAKAVRTASCVVHVGTPIEQCRKVNEERLAGRTTSGSAESLPDADEVAPYQPEVFENLIQRYEEPNGMTRWDSPLFTVPFEDAEPPCEAIWDAIMDTEGKARVARPNAATVLPTARPEGSLSALERATQAVIDRIAAWSQDHPGEGGGEISLEGVDDPIVLPVNGITQPQLQRLRRQFVGMNRNQHGLMKKERMAAHFVAFLNDAWGTGPG